MQSASSSDEDIEGDHRVHGAAALLPSVSPNAAAAAAPPASAIEGMGHMERHANTSEQQKQSGHKPVITRPQLLLHFAHVAPPKHSKLDFIRP